jgi:EAL domain-containing protein (putative c-di-GMP-specific phosphodiesterase class I)
VEEEEQVRLLRELGCDQIQGFFVSRPVPAEDIDAMLSAAYRGLEQNRSAA